jgi:hypothetical protein
MNNIIYFCQKIKIRNMDNEAKKWENLDELLEEIKRKNGQKEGKTEKKTLEKFYGCLKWGVDGVEYQRAIRSEWD